MNLTDFYPLTKKLHSLTERVIHRLIVLEDHLHNWIKTMESETGPW